MLQHDVPLLGLQQKKFITQLLAQHTQLSTTRRQCCCLFCRYTVTTNHYGQTAAYIEHNGIVISCQITIPLSAYIEHNGIVIWHEIVSSIDLDVPLSCQAYTFVS